MKTSRPSVLSLLQLFEEKGDQGDIYTHYIVSMEVQPLNEPFLPCNFFISILYYRDDVKDVLYCACTIAALGHDVAIHT